MQTIRVEYNGLVLDVPVNELAEQLANQPFTLPTHWTPITGEESLPKDDEALCLFCELNSKGIVTFSLVVSWRDFKAGIYKIAWFTHYTILTTPLK